MTIMVMLLTCDRPPERGQYAATCLKSLTNLHATEPLHLHIADDGSASEYRDALAEQGRKLRRVGKGLVFEGVSVTDAGGRGYGGNYNAATQVVHAIGDLVLPLEDDWRLAQGLDLDPIAAVLRDGFFGCVRLGYVGYTQELRAKFVSARGLMWLGLDPDSPEPHVFAGGPRLESVEYERLVGPWPENLPAGETEFSVAHRREARVGVGWPIDIVHPRGDAFVHIGTYKAEQSAAIVEEVPA